MCVTRIVPWWNPLTIDTSDTNELATDNYPTFHCGSTSKRRRSEGRCFTAVERIFWKERIIWIKFKGTSEVNIVRGPRLPDATGQATYTNGDPGHVYLFPDGNLTMFCKKAVNWYLCSSSNEEHEHQNNT